jgi:preprotein translocase subunit Sec61beta
MITTEELRSLASSTHPLHGDLVRVCNALLAERAKMHGLVDKWASEANEMIKANPSLAVRIAFNNQILVARELHEALEQS